MNTSITVNDDEIAKFSKIAEEWWKADGKFRPLHEMTPIRINYIREQIKQHFHITIDSFTPLTGFSVVDIGCGGGLASEPLARLGASVTGIDASGKNIEIARLHATQQGLKIDYRHTTAESLVLEQQRFDVVVALEIIEHVADVNAFIQSLATLAKPGGMVFISTINRTLKSLAMAKIGAEYILRWLPVGTHDWKKFMRPSEIVTAGENNELLFHDLQGMVYHPLSRSWSLNKCDVSVNFILNLIKKPL